jgi:antagonist of KipI
MSITILKAGILDTLQDAGRSGYRAIGIGSSGAMDNRSLAIANCLAGNDPGATGLELHFPASSLRFNTAALIALSGADFAAQINGKALPLNRPLYIAAESVLQFRRKIQGSQCYMAVRGGWQADTWLGSTSTHLKLGKGGYKGRALRANDEVHFTPSAQPQTDITGFIVYDWGYNPGTVRENVTAIRALEGSEWKQLSYAAQEAFTGQSFRMLPQSDRMGYYLEGPPLQRLNEEELVSAPVQAGTVQLLPNGRLIVLMADHQTVGGYPKIAQVITADKGKLAQLSAGKAFTFTFISQEQAEQARLEYEEEMQQLYLACQLKYSQNRR